MAPITVHTWVFPCLKLDMCITGDTTDLISAYPEVLPPFPSTADPSCNMCAWLPSFTHQGLRNLPVEAVVPVDTRQKPKEKTNTNPKSKLKNYPPDSFTKWCARVLHASPPQPCPSGFGMRKGRHVTEKREYKQRERQGYSTRTRTGTRRCVFFVFKWFGYAMGGKLEGSVNVEDDTGEWKNASMMAHCRWC